MLGLGILMSVGAGLVIAPLIIAVTAAVRASHAGAVSGLVNTSRQVGGSLGLAALTSVSAATARVSLLLPRRSRRPGRRRYAGAAAPSAGSRTRSTISVISAWLGGPP